MNSVEFSKLLNNHEPKTLLKHLLDWEYNPKDYIHFVYMFDYYSDLCSKYCDYSDERDYYFSLISSLENYWIPFPAFNYCEEIGLIQNYLYKN